MHLPSKPKVVVLGMMTKMPVAGVVWQTVHYLVGFERLGCEVYYVEQHARTPSMFMETEQCDGAARAATFIDGVMRRFDLGGRWCFHALHEPEPRFFGMTETQLRQLFAEADLIINLHGGTIPLPEHYATKRLVYLETDPVQLQIELHDNVPETIAFLEPHCAFFTFGENLGAPDCGLPISDRFRFLPTRQPVVMGFWEGNGSGGAHRPFTTIGNWVQQWREVWFRGERYSWSKHYEFLKFIDLPKRTAHRFELALASFGEEEKTMLEGHGWGVRHAMDFSMDTGAYREYIAGSLGEFTVAKDQNVRLRSGWFSDRSATYLAAGRPVITQDTGFGNALPTGCGLFRFSTMEEVLAALESINADGEKNRRAAAGIARDYFNYDVVLGKMLRELGIVPHSPRAHPALAFPSRLPLTPLSRRPIRLPEVTLRTVLGRHVPTFAPLDDPATRRASIIVVTHNHLVFTRLSLESVLANTDYANFELLVVDNASTDGTPDYLRTLAAQNPQVRPFFNAANLGFAKANNQGLAAATGECLLLLNNDTMVPPHWLGRLLQHLTDPTVGLLGPVTNRIGNESEIPSSYQTYGEFLEFAESRACAHQGELREIAMPAMFCLALQRDTFEKIGPLDEQFEIGLFEDDDYAMRCRKAGLRIVCAEDVAVHHFGEASFGDLYPSGEHSEVFSANRARFENKWGIEWQGHESREKTSYPDLIARLREAVIVHTPPGAFVLVVSKGDDALLQLSDRQAAHFPQAADGSYAGHHPADDAEAIAGLEKLRAQGASCVVFPEPSSWWFEHYAGLRPFLAAAAQCVEVPTVCRIFQFRQCVT